METIDSDKALIIGGNFNYTHDARDCNVPKKRDSSESVLRVLIIHFSLVDIWREQNPETDVFTYVRDPLVNKASENVRIYVYSLKMNNDTVTEFILLGLSNDPVTQILLFVVFTTVYILILLGNTLIIFLTITDQCLHTPMYFFLFNLSLLDILYSTSLLPRMLKDLLSLHKSISFGELFISVVFFISISYVALTLNVNLCGHNKINHFICEVPEIISLGCENISVVEFVIYLGAIVILLTPVTFIAISYIQIILTILNLASGAGKQKAFSTCSSHIMVVTIFYGSAMAAYVKPKSSSVPDNDKIIALFYVFLTPLLNPFIYTIRNKDVKESLKKMLSLERFLLRSIYTKSFLFDIRRI
ncbi:olfactory receptor 1019 [Xenopus laevis]|uniref:Olfactory receptor 1019 n=1 Tax=Xenopus laevis TaxID=8355 RepID=A0A8J1LSG2_XENLA|nr:olfactory receptor 1019 [Xenopus laevis]